MSSNEWGKYKFSEIMTIIGGGTPKTKIKEYWNGTIPWLSVKDFNSDERFVYQTEKTITQLGVNSSSTKVLNKGDLIISARGTVGEIAQLGREMAFNQSCYGLRANEKTTNDFLYYLLKYTTKNILQNTHGSVFDTITREVFDLIEINLPPLEEQKAIAKILSDLDAKIEVNNQISQRLEEMAQALFKHWFVDFEFPNEDGEPYKSSGGEMIESELGLIPKGWEVSVLSSIANYQNGLAMQKFRPEGNDKSYPVMKIKELRQGNCDKNSERCTKKIDKKYLVKSGDVIFSWSGTLVVDLWSSEDAGLNQHIFKVTSEKYDKWFYYLWTQRHLNNFIHIAKSKATTLGHIKKGDLDTAKLVIPTQEILHRAELIFSNLINQIIAGRYQNNILKQTRDTLLPKLMSGELRVTDIQD